ncbi:MAG: hypothetical protein GY928_14175 [Colwellia sp.]|nr:hypothetical protein [Colwellia sp.]
MRKRSLLLAKSELRNLSIEKLKTIHIDISEHGVKQPEKTYTHKVIRNSELGYDLLDQDLYKSNSKIYDIKAKPLHEVLIDSPVKVESIMVELEKGEKILMVGLNVKELTQKHILTAILSALCNHRANNKSTDKFSKLIQHLVSASFKIDTDTNQLSIKNLEWVDPLFIKKPDQPLKTVSENGYDTDTNRILDSEAVFIMQKNNMPHAQIMQYVKKQLALEKHKRCRVND